MPNYDYFCDQCNFRMVHSCAYRDRPEQITVDRCLMCDKETSYTYRIAAPNIMQAAYPDGTRRFQDVKEAAKLEKEAAHSKLDRKKEIAAEIKKMGIRTSKPVL